MTPQLAPSATVGDRDATRDPHRSTHRPAPRHAPRRPTSSSTATAGATASACPSTAPTATRSGRAATTGSSSPTTTPASSYGTAPAARMRVRLKRNRAQRISGATLARAANGRRVRLAETRIYRFQQVLDEQDRRSSTRPTGHTRARLVAPVTVTGGANTTRARHGRQRPAQRRLPRPGRALARRRARSSWSTASASSSTCTASSRPRCRRAGPPRRSRRRPSWRARTPCAAAGRASPTTCSPTSARRSTAACWPRPTPPTRPSKATRAGVVMAGGQIAQTFFFSTSGGRTATNEEAFGGTPISYLRSVDDPHDDLSPYHDWTARFTAGGRPEALALGHQRHAPEPSGRVAARRPAAPRRCSCAAAAAIRRCRRRRSARCWGCAARGSRGSAAAVRTSTAAG